MNLHITYDNVFMDYVIRFARELGVSQDRFLVYLYYNQEKPALVKSAGIEYARFMDPGFFDLVGDWKQYRNVYIHWLCHEAIDIVNRIPPGINVIWCFWGGDGLEQPSLLKWVYQPKSYRYYMQHLARTPLDWRHFGSFKRRFREIRREKLARDKHLRAMRRVDYFAHYLPEDFKKVRKAAGLRAQYIDFHYASVEDLLEGAASSDPALERPDILLGNSDTITNNHFEAIDALSGLDLSGRRVLCPLSYEKGAYARDVAFYGTERLGKAFRPLLDFLPRTEYNRLLTGVGYAVMNHNRSQALGNITALLNAGTKVFMSRDSTLYRFLSGSGFSISTTEDLKQGSCFSPLSEEQTSKNRSLLLKHFGREAQKEKIRRLLTL